MEFQHIVGSSQSHGALWSQEVTARALLFAHKHKLYLPSDDIKSFWVRTKYTLTDAIEEHGPTKSLGVHIRMTMGQPDG